MPSPTFVSIDLETRSLADLRATGVHRYAEDPSTQVICLTYAYENEPVKIWRCLSDPMPAELFHLMFSGAYFKAWNAQFERTIWNQVLTRQCGVAPLPTEKWVCSMAIGRAAGLPGSLEEAAIALGLQEQKDKEGSRLMLQMTKPRSLDPLTWWEDEDRLKRLEAYCAQDVVVEREIWKRLPPAMNRRERQIWLADQAINDRGVKLDIPLILAASKIAVAEQSRLSRAIKRVTGGAVSSITRVADLKTWLMARIGVDVESVDKASIEALLADDTLATDVRDALLIRQEAAKSSVKKLEAMLKAVGSLNRVRGLLQYFGAATGRWAGRLVQPQNFPRGAVKVTAPVIDALLTGNPMVVAQIGSPLEVVSSALRGMLVAAPGKTFYVADYGQIEARVVAWLAGQKDLLQLFADGGLVYEEMAAVIYGIPVDQVTKDQRQVGKMAILACGFQMGAKRFAEQAGVELSLAEMTVAAYRAKNYRIRELWWALQDTALTVVTKGLTSRLEVPGTGGKLAFRTAGKWLAMDLPSGRSLWYYDPKIEMRSVPWSKDLVPSVQVMAMNSYTRKWEPAQMYGGLWCENATQAVARDLMADAILRLEAKGFPVVLTVHDEIIAEAYPTESVETFVNLLSEVPSWAEGCPVKAEGWSGSRYRK
jgi:DNA polymerase